MIQNRLACKYNDRIIEKKLGGFEELLEISLTKHRENKTPQCMDCLFIDDISYGQLQKKIEEQTKATKTKKQFALVALPEWKEPVIAFYVQGLMYLFLKRKYYRLIIVDHGGTEKDKRRVKKLLLGDKAFLSQEINNMRL